MYDIIIRNAQLVTSKDITTQDVAIQDGKIVKIFYPITSPSEREIEGAGLHLMPGCIDPHVHLRTPGNTHKEDITTGTRAAIKGGYTTVFDMPNTSPSTTTQEALDSKKELAREMSYSNIGFHYGAVPGNVKTIKDIDGVSSVKMYMGASTGDLLVDDLTLQEAMFKHAGDLTILVHAENEEMIQEATKIYKGQEDPEIHSCIRHEGCAVKAVQTAVDFSKKYNTKLHVCHISTKAELDVIVQAKKEGAPVTCEVGPHHLFLNYDFYSSLGTYVKMNPPVRSEADTEVMWKGLREGTIDCIGSDHAPHTKEEKDQSYWKAPSGVPELDTSLQLLLLAVHEGKISFQDLVYITGQRPAEILNLQDRGLIKEGYIADLILVDFEKEWIITEEELETKCKWSPYKNWEGKGKCVLTMLGGEVVYDAGVLSQSDNIEVF